MTNHFNHINDELLAGYLLNEIDQQSRREVEKWLGKEPENARYFQHFKTIWQASTEIKLPTQIDENAAWQRFLDRTKANAPAHKVKVAHKRLLNQVAASLLIGISLLAIGYFTWDIADHSPVSVASDLKTLSTALPDGSLVTLNRDSEISYTRKLKGQQRRVELKGEAYFKITPDKIKPFVVDINEVTVTVVGTSFNIKGYKGRTEVIVETGKVHVRAKGRSVFLEPGERVVIDNRDSIVSEERVSGKLYNYYVTREFVCDNTPLWKLVEVLNEAYDARIEIINPALLNLPLTTTFHKEPLDNILNVISETFDIKITRSSNRIQFE